MASKKAMVAEAKRKAQPATTGQFEAFAETQVTIIAKMADAIKWQAMKMNELEGKVNILRDGYTTLYEVANKRASKGNADGVA